MKNIRFTILFIWLSIYSVSAQINDIITFSINDIEIDTIGNYSKLSMLGCSYTDVIGYPELPRLEVRYVIPTDRIVSDVIVSDSVVQILQGDYLIIPHQPSTRMGDTSAFFVQPDSTVYKSNLLYPRKMVELVEQYYEFGYHIALLYVYPLIYYPQQQTLRFNSSISLSLSLSNNEMVILQPKKASERMIELCKSLLKSKIRNVNALNGNNECTTEVVGMNESYPVSNALLSNEFDVIPEFLIITNNRDINGNELEPFENQTMLDLFKSFANWKTKKGLPSVVVTVDDISNNYSGNDIQAKIHNFLADVYNELGSMYVLLGGDINIVPEREIKMDKKMSGGNVDHLTFATDLYYSAIGSSWDSNMNGEYGETELKPYSNDWINIDQSDNISDFFLARIPVSNCFEANSFINKTLSYEDLSGINPIDRRYINNVIALMAFLDEKHNPENEPLNIYMSSTNSIFGITEPAEYGINQESILKWRGFESKKNLHPSVLNYWMPMCKDVAFSCFNSTIPISTGEKAHIILHCDHSSYQSLGTAVKNTGGLLNRAEVDLLENYPFNKILISYGCSPGDFRKDCIIEHLLNNPNGGVVSAIASSTTSYDEYYRIQPLLQKLYQWKAANGVIHQPVLYNIALLHNNTLGTGMLNTRKNHLFGDPELPIWTREPVDLTVSTSPSTITNQNGQLTVSVSGMAYSEYATNDVYVCVMKDGEVYQREHYDGTAHNHDFVFDVNPETAGTLKVTVTGHNYIPYETTVPVSITGKNVYISNKVVIDGSGNSNGSLDAGETVNLSISLKNNGTVNLTNVRADLSCEFLDDDLNQHINDYLTLNTSTASFGSIAKNATVTRNSYQMTLSNAIPDRSSLRCTLVIRDGSGVICTRSFTLPISAPEIEHVSVRHETKPNGRIGLDIELNNIGFGAAKGVVASLASSSGVQITQGTATYGAMAHLEAKKRPFEFIPNGNVNGKSFTLTVTDAYNKSWSYDFTLYNMLDTVENLTFENTEHSIKLRWDPVEDSRGYYVYRSLTSNGNYERLNSYPIPSSVYPDMGLGAKQTYYYGVSYLDEHGNESEKAHITAWTSLPVAAGWPITIPDDLGRVWGTAPNVTDINGDGYQEIFLTTGTGDQSGNVGAILGFNSLGEELYDIDHNPTTISGFANIGISMTSTPAVGDIDNDGVMEVVIATRCDENENNYKLCVYKNIDVNTDGVPDLAWERPIDYKNFNGVVLADLDDNGTLEIIAPNQGRNGNNGYAYTYLEVFNCVGGYYYPKNKIKVLDKCNADGKAVTMPVIADLDNDGYKEIVFGLEGGIYSWSCRTEQLSTLVPFNEDNKERTDCPVIAADIDGNGDKEILYMAIKNGNGYIRAINIDGTSVNGWNGDTHFIPLSNTNMNWAWPPYFSVGDIDNDGSVEIFAADNGVLKIWTSSGLPFGTGQIQIPNLDCRYFQPIIADIDGHGDCEIIIPSQNGYIYAYKTNGNAVPGWPLSVTELGTIPAVTDIDGDGYNEVVAASQTEVYVWHTEGESKYNQCDRFRYNKYNNAVYEVPCSYVSTPLEISNTQVWNDERQCNMDVVINNGAGLTIKSAVRFSANAKIIVKPGGRLVIDGGRLTSSCPNSMWSGIEVWGNSAAHQYPVNGHYAQGYVELKNGAVIENAECALALWRPGHWSTTGGIVHAEDATFRNCAMAVHALHYTNHHPATGKETHYDSRFRNCTFAIDGDYIGTTTFYKHIDLAHVNGISFAGCDFSADRSVQGVSGHCTGIAAYSSGFSATAFCDHGGGAVPSNPCPEPLLKGCTFTGFHRGIHASNDGSAARTFTVRDATFNNNTCGVHALNTGFATVIGCDFAVGCGSECDFGIHADHVTGFCIEENTFRPVFPGMGQTYGILVADSEGGNDIYRNTFSGLLCGNVAVGNNSQAAGSLHEESWNSGLTYSCNANSGNQADFCVLDGGPFSGIMPQQGSAAKPAGNTFSDGSWHLHNGGDYQITYYHNSADPGQAPDPAKLHNVATVATPSANPCPTHYGGGGVVKSAAEKAALAEGYASAGAAHESLARVYASRIDGGSTPAETADINTAAPSDLWRLRAKLLGHSPYLSQEALTAAADRHDVFPESVLFEILAANPDELKKDTLIRYMEQKESPLPQYMTDLLRQMASGTTARTALLAQMGHYAHERDIAAGDIVRSNLNDSLATPADLRAWLGNMESLAADRLAVASFVQQRDFGSALALAESLPELYGLQGSGLDDHSDCMSLLSLYQTLDGEGRNAHQMTEAEAAMVEGIAENGRGASRAMAEALLQSLSDGRVPSIDCPRLPETAGGRGTAATPAPALLSKALGFSASLSPNPATTWVAIDYTLPQGAAKATLILTNALGVAVMAAELDGSQGQKVLNLRPLAAGVYGYAVRCGEYVQHGKIVVTK